jgi:hypothetical protein
MIDVVQVLGCVKDKQTFNTITLVLLKTKEFSTPLVS